MLPIRLLTQRLRISAVVRRVCAEPLWQCSLYFAPPAREVAGRRAMWVVSKVVSLANVDGVAIVLTVVGMIAYWLHADSFTRVACSSTEVSAILLAHSPSKLVDCRRDPAHCSERCFHTAVDTQVKQASAASNICSSMPAVISQFDSIVSYTQAHTHKHTLALLVLAHLVRFAHITVLAPFGVHHVCCPFDCSHSVFALVLW